MVFGAPNMKRALHVFCLATSLLLSRAGNNFGAHELICLDPTKLQRVLAEGRLVLTSAPIRPQVNWNELIVSWNFRNTNSGVRIETRVSYPDHSTRWYTLGIWSAHGGIYPRESVRGQKDEDGEVKTDTLVLTESGGEVQVRVVIEGENRNSGDLKLLTLCFSDAKGKCEQSASFKEGWGTELQVPERSQANYPEGISEWCSPTSTSMILSFWAKQLDRADLDHDVPEVARGVHDPKWPGTGNWPFNTAYAGAHAGMRAYVARFADVAELETWVNAGFPIGASVSYNKLKGRAQGGSGHIVVVIGMGKNGEMVINDPGRKQVHQIYPRENFIKAWAESQNTVYLIYPERAKIPPNSFRHWCE
jgi:hypothetical protein